jgi:hypothetical protein
MLDDGNSGDGTAGDDEYGAAIAAFPDDTVVRYWIEALDDLGATSAEPLPAPVTAHVYVVGYRPPPLVVNEFMADNDNIVEDPNEPQAFEDWLEIYNGGVLPVSLDGMYLTDNLLFPTKFPLPDGLVVWPNIHLVLWADGEPWQGKTHLDFQLSAIGEQIGIADVDARGNVWVDAMSFGPQTMDVAEGSCPDGYSPMQTMVVPSPGTANSGEAGCLDGSVVAFQGTATGGTVSVTLEGVIIAIPTFSGDTSADVAWWLADGANADGSLAGMGVGASAVGPRFITNGEVTDVTIDDATVQLLPEPSALSQLVAGAGLLAFLASRQRVVR